MCIVFFITNPDEPEDNLKPYFPVVVAFNRDESIWRESTPLEHHGDLIMGTDKLTGTTWFGFNKITGNLAFLTNYRQIAPDGKGLGIGIAGCLYNAPLGDLAITSRLLRNWYKGSL